MEDFEYAAIAKNTRRVNKRLARTMNNAKLSTGAIQEMFDIYTEKFNTPSMRFKAGEKYLQSLTSAELSSYISNVDALDRLISTLRSSSMIVEAFGEEVGSTAIWRLYNYMKAQGAELPSEMVKELADAELDLNEKNEVLVEMLRYLVDDDYGIADFDEFYNTQHILK